MSEVITDKDKEYEALERESAPGPDQAMSDRVNNRSLRPRSDAFKEFMTTGWDDNEPAIEPLESSKYTPARLEALGRAFPPRNPGRSTEGTQQRLRLRIPSGHHLLVLHRSWRGL